MPLLHTRDVVTIGFKFPNSIRATTHGETVGTWDDGDIIRRDLLNTSLSTQRQ